MSVTTETWVELALVQYRTDPSFSAHVDGHHSRATLADQTTPQEIAAFFGMPVGSLNWPAARYLLTSYEGNADRTPS